MVALDAKQGLVLFLPFQVVQSLNNALRCALPPLD